MLQPPVPLLWRLSTAAAAATRGLCSSLQKYYRNAGGGVRKFDADGYTKAAGAEKGHRAKEGLGVTRAGARAATGAAMEAHHDRIAETLRKTKGVAVRRAPGTDAVR